MATPAPPGEPEAHHTGTKVLVLVVAVLVVLWQLRAPLTKAGCATGRLPALICVLAEVDTPKSP
jgi:hypothetical protein